MADFDVCLVTNSTSYLVESKSSDGEGLSLQAILTACWRLKVRRYKTLGPLVLGLLLCPEDMPHWGQCRATAKMWPRRHNQQVRHRSVSRPNSDSRPRLLSLDRSSFCGSRMWRPMILHPDAGVS
jgi:hypothetical protein